MLVDTGASKNYIKPHDSLSNVIPVQRQFQVTSIHGKNTVTHKCKLSIFGVQSSFYLLPEMSSFDGIIGFDTLHSVDARIMCGSGELITGVSHEKLSFSPCPTVNSLAIRAEDVPDCVKESFHQMLEKNIGAFADPNEALPFNTNIIGTIRTTDNEPVYSKAYPYPVSVTEFVNKEIESMLKMGIIRPSRSPFNNPLWVVDKKGQDELGNRNHRLVHDFRKLNDKTIDDKYPIPDITTLLSNLGKAKFYTTLDLKSGFHQIELAEEDREKTAFSVNNGKYEFCRLPFGLKNAPSIFQRAIDDVLRENIGKYLGVYIDDVIIYSESEEEHVRHIEWVLNKLEEANMRVSIEKSSFFKTRVEYLGFIVTREGIRTCPSKIEAIKNFPEPKSLFHLRSFLGLAGHYRRFVRNFAATAKPLTDNFKGENGKIGARMSKKVAVNLNATEKESFNKLIEILSSEDVILLYPDFSRPLELTTDASSSGLGAVLSQEGRPITMISRSLKDRETEFATNERELLAIVWALKRLRNYLYGAKNLQIFTDHQPLTFSVSNKNTNAKIKRWMAFVEEHNAKICYKPGKENVVADALSRHMINALDCVSTAATAHSVESLTSVIRKTDKPLNVYKNQIVIEEAGAPSTRTFILFQSKKRHLVQYSDQNTIFESVKNFIIDGAVNAIKCDPHVLSSIQHRLVESFPAARFWHAPKCVMDISNREEQKEILLTEHNRAHRCAQNLVKTVLRDHYFPKMGKLASEVVKNCNICLEAKYPRNPIRQKLGVTPIPSFPGEMLHIDIFSTDKQLFLTCVDKFSKFAVTQQVPSRSIVDVTPALLQLINIFPGAKQIFCDNEASFNSHTVEALLSRYRITVVNSAPQHSLSNGQVERFHSTLQELARCLKEERQISDTAELILLATLEYNKTIHSVTLEKPEDAFHSSDVALRDSIKTRLFNAQNRQLAFFNKKRHERKFNVGDVVWVKQNRRLGNKLSRRYVKRKIEADLGSTVVIKGKIVHKDNLR